MRINWLLKCAHFFPFLLRLSIHEIIFHIKHSKAYFTWCIHVWLSIREVFMSLVIDASKTFFHSFSIFCIFMIFFFHIEVIKYHQHLPCKWWSFIFGSLDFLLSQNWSVYFITQLNDDLYKPQHVVCFSHHYCKSWRDDNINFH